MLITKKSDEDKMERTIRMHIYHSDKETLMEIKMPPAEPQKPLIAYKKIIV
jgi:hypothetical protein